MWISAYLGVGGVLGALLSSYRAARSSASGGDSPDFEAKVAQLVRYQVHINRSRASLEYCSLLVTQLIFQTKVGLTAEHCKKCSSCRHYLDKTRRNKSCTQKTIKVRPAFAERSDALQRSWHPAMLPATGASRLAWRPGAVLRDTLAAFLPSLTNAIWYALKSVSLSV